ncbi:RND family transporter [Marinobacter sp. SS8-8]|uniref:efflux RND transporter permease subunit n=1 Tax=Marinobacter sp. SS8-8 TaxID=3050452 RepID=UPI0026DF30CA|nr:MMPL family transporter [Marinobacter sp. SS8-8]
MAEKTEGSWLQFATDRPRLTVWAMVAVTLALVALAALPSVWPERFGLLNPLTIDTDPENMLSADEPVRVFHDDMKEQFSLYDMVVVGVVNENDPDGVFNVGSLRRIYELTEYASTLRWPDPDNPGRQEGVVEEDMLALSRVDNIEQEGVGAVRFSWLMPEPPDTRKQALAILERAQRIPLFDNTLVSDDGKAVALYLPLTSKDMSYRVREALLDKVAGWKDTGDQVYITGLPVAEDTFGVQMFYQMAISAPLAMLVIFLAMWWFFRHVRLITSAMIVAVVAAAGTMALLVISGNTVHIMSSMIPVFIMPIAVLDAVHILSEFFDRYPQHRDRRRAILEVMGILFKPMLFTTLTTMAGFASLALTPIPPVQVFGIFIAIGVFLAWLCTVTFIPAYIMLMPERRLTGFGHAVGDPDRDTVMGRWLRRLGEGVVGHARAVLVVTMVVVVAAGYGISLIRINDNPVKWFEPEHPIRVADRVLNEHFGGTYMAYLALVPEGDEVTLADYQRAFLDRLASRQKTVQAQDDATAAVFEELRAMARKASEEAGSAKAFLDGLDQRVGVQLDAAPDARYDAWLEAQSFVDAERQRNETFKRPEVLRYIARLQQRLGETGVVGKSNSLADVVKTVHRELLGGDAGAFRIPDRPGAVAQTLLTYQNGHRPQDLWHFVTPDYRRTSIWVQLTSGDNRDMSRVVQALNDFIAANPPPASLQARWFGLNYINVIWQEKMVSGMAMALFGSFVMVLLLMAVLFRSLLWGLLCMIPLTVTIGAIYGVIGIIGKNYDMPVAVLSALSLGLAVDYAIHFLARARAIQAETGSWRRSVAPMFGEPARAITRNAIVLGVGFLPLLAAPLVPYQTVGVFIAAILLTAGLSTLLILPALVTLLQRWLFPGSGRAVPNPQYEKEGVQ